MKKLFLLGLCVLPHLLFAIKTKREVVKTFPVSGLNKLVVNNAYGNITLTKAEGDEIKVKTLITTDIIEMEDTINIYPNIHNDIEIQKNQLSIHTKVSDDLVNMEPVYVHYFVSIPDTFDLDITNRYGNLLMFDVYGSKNIILEYGKIFCSNLLGPDAPRSTYSLHYSELKADKSSNADIFLNSSELHIGSIEKADIQSIFSYVVIDNTTELNCTSETDKYQIQSVDFLKIDGANTSCYIGELNNYFEMELQKGNVTVSHVSEEFTDINLDLEEVESEITFSPKAAFFFNATLKYGELIYPKNLHINKVSDFGTESFNGEHGKADESGSQIGIVGNQSKVNIKISK